VQVPQATEPHAFETVPQVAVPHTGAVQAMHVPPAHCVPAAHVPQFTVPLPHALPSVPHFDPRPPSLPASLTHSGGVFWQVPPMHWYPVSQEQRSELPQLSLIVPQRFRPFGVHVSGAHFPVLPPASSGACVTHALLTQVCPVGHPGQLMATPQESMASSPHLPVQEVL
jgi:hypothetical protein